MTETKVKRKQQRHTMEFKTEAAKMVVEQGQPQAVVACNLGIAAGQMNRWLADYKTNAGAAFP